MTMEVKHGVTYTALPDGGFLITQVKVEEKVIAVDLLASQSSVFPLPDTLANNDNQKESKDG